MTISASHPSVDRLAEMWLARDAEFHAAADRMLADFTLDDCLPALSDVLAGDFPRVRAELREIAAWDAVDTDDGATLLPQLFAIPVRGAAEDLGRLLSDPVLHRRLVEALKTSGMVASEATTTIYPWVFSPQDAAKVSPGVLRWLALAAIPSDLAPSAADVAAVLDRLGGRRPSALPHAGRAGYATPTTAVLIGVRLLVRVGEDVEEDAVGGFTGSEAEAFEDEAMDRWARETSALVAEANLSLHLANPAEWDDALACVAANIIHGAIAIEAGARGLDMVGISEVHLYETPNEVVVSMRAGDNVFGPASAPANLVAGSRGAFDAWVGSVARVVRTHTSLSDLPGVPATRH